MSNWKIIVNGSTKDFDTDYGFTIQQAPGTGMPAMKNVSSKYGLLDGALYQRTIAQPRVFTLTGLTDTGVVDCGSAQVSQWHVNRKDLIDAIKPNRGVAPSPVEIQYTGGASTISIKAYYDGGMEMGIAETGQEAFGLRFVAFDPFWETTTTASINMTPAGTYVNSQLGKLGTSGSWFAIGQSTTGCPLAMVETLEGNLLIGGSFMDFGGTAASSIILYNTSTSTFSALDGGIDSGSVWAVARGPGTNLYAGGDFEQAGSSTAVTASMVAVWNGTQWAGVPTSGGIQGGIVYDLAVDEAGHIYACGTFDKVTNNGVDTITASRIAMSDTTAWTHISWGFQDTVRAVAVDDKFVYAGGDFTTAGSGTDTVRHIARRKRFYLKHATEVDWQELGSGLNDVVRDIAVAPDGSVYIVGDFTADNDGNTLNRICRWTGEKLEAVDSGVDDAVYSVFSASDGRLFISGDFQYAVSGCVPIDLIAEWWADGGFWPLNMLFSVATITNARQILETTIGETFVIHQHIVGGGPPLPMWSLTTASNTGTANAYPVITASGPGQLLRLRNHTAHQTIAFKDYTLLTGETLTIDLSPSAKSFTSDFLGDVMYKVLPGTDVATWSMLPGENNISFLAADTSTNADFKWTPRFWSIDT